jgi:hypothetical protein
MTWVTLMLVPLLTAVVPSAPLVSTVRVSVLRAVQFRKNAGGSSIATMKSPLDGKREPSPVCKAMVESPAVYALLSDD